MVVISILSFPERGSVTRSGHKVTEAFRVTDPRSEGASSINPFIHQSINPLTHGRH